MAIYWLEQSESDVPGDNQWLGPEEMICLHSMRFPKRRTDWRLGRWTAKHAVAACLNLPSDLSALAHLEIRAAPSGAPEVFLQNCPAGVSISLSHRAGMALCTVGRSGSNFGCDLEVIEPRTAAFAADYFTLDEQVQIAAASSQERALLINLLWSCKESALKAMRVGLRLDTRSVSASIGECPPLARNSDEWNPIRVCYTNSQLFSGWWRVQDSLIRTIVSDAALPIPLHVDLALSYREVHPSSPRTA